MPSRGSLAALGVHQFGRANAGCSLSTVHHDGSGARAWVVPALGLPTWLFHICRCGADRSFRAAGAPGKPRRLAVHPHIRRRALQSHRDASLSYPQTRSASPQSECWEHSSCAEWQYEPSTLPRHPSTLSPHEYPLQSAFERHWAGAHWLNGTAEAVPVTVAYSPAQMHACPEPH
jgi:hypothetical protein